MLIKIPEQKIKVLEETPRKVLEFPLDNDLNLTEKEVEELRSCEDIKFVLSEHHPIHNSHITDDYGNEIKPTQYTYNVVVEILPSTEERESKVETFISSLTLPGKDHRIDRFSRDYNYLKEELGINIEHKKRNS